MTVLGSGTFWKNRRGPLAGSAGSTAAFSGPGPGLTGRTAYGALAAYVADHALQVDGPLREYYLVGRQDTADESAWRTEVCWPIFSTGAAA